MKRVLDRRLLTVVVSVAFFALASAWVTAQGAGSGAALIPYQGHLELHGVPVDGDIDVRIGLFQNSATANAACLATAASCGLWTDAFSDVPVHNGSFSLMLGSQAALNDNLFEYDTLYVGLAVAEAGGTLVALGGLQRLASVPYAVRTERSPDLYVSGSVGVGTPSPGTKLHVENGTVRVRSTTNNPGTQIGAFLSNNLAQGIGIAYDGIVAIGANTDQNLRLTPKGDGSVIVDGRLLEEAVQNLDGAETLYYKEGGRYLARASYQATGSSVRRTVEIPESVLLSYCGDVDGCTVKMGMKNYHAGLSRSTSVGPFAFYYGSTLEAGNVRHWRKSSDTRTNAEELLEADDGDGTVRHVIKEFDCYFTDGFYSTNGTANDLSRGMGLLNYNASAGLYTPECWLTIDD